MFESIATAKHKRGIKQIPEQTYEMIEATFIFFRKTSPSVSKMNPTQPKMTANTNVKTDPIKLLTFTQQ
jgi:hypothetical protein